MFCFLFLFLSVSSERSLFPCNSSVLGFMFIQSLFLISVSGSCFLFFVLFVFVSRCSFVFVLVCLLSCFV